MDGALLLQRERADRFASRWFPDENPMTVELAKCEDFELADLAVRPALRTVEAGDKKVTLEPRVMQVLVLLAQNIAQPIDRDTMIEECWGGVIVGDDSIQRCIGRLRRLASELGGFEIETIPRVGYRLLADGHEAASNGTARDLAASAPPSLAVRRAVYRGPRESGDDFAQVLAQDIATALSINREVAVLTADAADDAQFVATIEIRETDANLRTRCSVVERASERIVWSEVADHDEIVASIAVGIPDDDLGIDLSARISAVVIREVTNSSLVASEAQSAWQAVVRANAAYQRIDLDSLAIAIVEARRAVELDPGYAAAHAALANALAAHYELGGAQVEGEAAEARRHCNIALALSPEDANVLAWTAHALLMITRPAEGLPLAEKAIALAPNHPIANLYLARHYLHHGRPDDALRALADHARIAPFFPWKYFPILQRGLARFMLGDIVGAEADLKEASDLNPVYPYGWISLLVVGAVKQDVELMRSAASRLRQIEGNDDLALQLARIEHSYPDPAQASVVVGAFKLAWEA